MTLEGRVALVTGGAGGMGASIVRDLAGLGATVAVCDIDEEGANRIAEATPRGRAFRVDLADPAEVDRLVATVGDELGEVDVLVSNAGWDKVGPFVTSDPSLWDRLIAINLRAPMQLTHAVLPGMLERRFGRLVFVSSDAARVGSTGEAVYAACKAGVIGFCKTVARETARKGVTANVVCPGPTDTPLLREVAEGNPKLVESLTRAIPVGRLGTPDDVSAAVWFFCTPRAEYMTGQTVSVSGGLTMV